jgi:signal transduction histidine kinase
MKRPSRWSLSNWPVRWKVFAIVLVPTILAVAFGAIRVYSSANDAIDLRLAADRAAVIRPINNYMSSLDGVLSAALPGADLQAALGEFDTRRAALQDAISATDVLPDVRTGVTGILTEGQDLRQKVESNSIGVRDRVTQYAPILLAAEDAITGSVRVDSENIRVQAEGLSRAVGCRGQMVMQQLLVNLGGDLPDPELRTSMITLAGTEPSTLFGMSQVLGLGSPYAATLREQMVNRMAMMSDPDTTLVDNPDLLQSLQTTSGIANKVINNTIQSIISAVDDNAAAQRTAAIRDSAIVLAAILFALLIVTLVARSLVRPLRKLRDGALKVAHEDLVHEIARVRSGAEPGPVEPLPVHTTEEVGQVAHAVDELHEQAVFMAGEQARLQLQVDDMFETLSRRSRSLVDQQLTLIDQLERDEEDPERLHSLFKLDHLAARMRRNGANLLVLAGAKVPREQGAPVPVSAIINAAASEVEDYTRVVTATVPDSAVIGPAAGDLVHLLAELVDNALRYSPPSSPVRVSAMHAGNGALVIEVADVGLGMTEPDLRVANTRLGSGGEVTPYTARHMGLFVVGRLTQQHGLVARLRSSVQGEPGSGTTAGVYVPAELLAYAGADDRFDQYGPDEGSHPEPRSGIAMARALDEAPAELFQYDQEPFPEPHLNGSSHLDSIHHDVPVALLPQRNPGASGISDIPPSLAVPPGSPEPGGAEPDPYADYADWPDQAAPPVEPVARAPMQVPTNTSAYFSSRDQASGAQASNGVPNSRPVVPEPVAPQPAGQAVAPPPPPEMSGPGAILEMPRRQTDAPGSSSDPAGSEDAIYQKMLSEWLIDPIDLANSDRQWESVWDSGWSAAAHAAEAPVDSHTENGLPVREPGARLVPGAVDSTAAEPFAPDQRNGGRQNGGAHRSADEVGSGTGLDAGYRDAGYESVPLRDPDAVRSTISNHFGGVRAGRSHAREPQGTENE